MEVTYISGSVPTQDKEAMEDTLEAYYGEIPGITFGMYIDISVLIRVGEGDWNAIRKTSYQEIDSPKQGQVWLDQSQILPKNFPKKLQKTS